jgi:2-polyprenyl-3-methyl-5-hydroxy-6-metoxy-1,4-benzoquinol methylase
MTSEPRICDYPSDLLYCRTCGHIQKTHTVEVETYIEKIYSEYMAHYISNGEEQLTFPKGLPPRPRTYHALKNCRAFLPEKGKLLDFGCGAGAALTSSSILLPGWTMYGYDLSPLHKDDILKIPNVRGFFSGTPANIHEGPFDLIILWQVLEHLEDPVYYLTELRKHLTARGMILISIPDTERNPFDLAIIDHCSHFTPHSLNMLLQKTGFRIQVHGRNWFHNMLTCLVSKDSSGTVRTEKYAPPERYVTWLQENARMYNKTVGMNRYAIFGTGMSSFWIYSQMSIKPEFFLDEDERRAGKVIDGIRVIHPADLDDTRIPIIVPFLRETGEGIVKKLRDKYPRCKNSSFILTHELK